MKMKINSFGPIISEKSVGVKIYDELSKVLKQKDIVNVDFKDVVSMATFCAKQIFGRLYIELGADSFFRRVKLVNVSEDLKIIIKMGIQSALEENNKSD